MWLPSTTHTHTHPPLGTGQAGENGVWYEKNRSVTLSHTAVASYFPLHFSSPSVLLSFLAPSTEPMSASHPYSPVLTLPSPPPTFCTFQTGESRSHLPVSPSPFHFPPLSHSNTLLFSSSLAFICFLSSSLSLTLHLSLRGGWGLAVAERDEFLIADGQRRPILLVRISQRGEAKAEEKKKKKIHFFFFHWLQYDHNCPLPSPLHFF